MQMGRLYREGLGRPGFERDAIEMRLCGPRYD